MKKGIAIGMLSVASVVLLGCQQQPLPATTTGPAGQQKATTTATVKITDAQGQTSSSTGSLEILPAGDNATKTAATGTLEIKPADGQTPGAPIVPPVPPKPGV